MTTYERVTYREEGARRSKTIWLRNPHEIPFLGTTALVGTQVNRVGDEIASNGAHERVCIIQTELVERRVPARWNLLYAELEIIPQSHD